MKIAYAGAAFTVAAALASFPTVAQNVKVTPIGSHPGELCNSDRATIFEDPSGVRILYDAGQTVTGPDDPRLGDLHVVLLSHAHGDHIGRRKLRPSSRAAVFVERIKGRATYLAISGRTMEFDGKGKCAAGC